MSLESAVKRCYERRRSDLLECRNEAGVWRGHLSSSALATAVAAFALRLRDRGRYVHRISAAEQWLVRHANDDGGWGDTPQSGSNLSTTLLVLAALRHSSAGGASRAWDAGMAWVVARAGSRRPADLAAAVLGHYGEDRTFSVPILTMSALGGMLGDPPGCWETIPRLPFELACLPRGWFSRIGLPVVSYALPALIALGVARYRLGRGCRWFPRGVFVPGALRRLRGLQPPGGGFLEAVPLTGFVVMSLVAADAGADEVISRGTAFLESAQRRDGGWPIDSDLATWVTTLSVNALRDDLPEEARPAIREWLLGQQWLRQHPYTGAQPGGWGWTDLPGSVPDADDTAGALVALYHLGVHDASTRHAAAKGVHWLLDLANRDGGIPTFCRGWGRLPFDRSCADITAHALRAFCLWRPQVSDREKARIDQAIRAGLDYLHGARRADGAWEPLWFGNEHAPRHANAVYGTARVLLSLQPLIEAGEGRADVLYRAGVGFLRCAQHRSGGWGGDRGVAPSMEETALAAAALATSRDNETLRRAGHWLVEHGADSLTPSPIGLYFASLWYYETLYPLVFTVDALKRWLKAMSENH